MKLKSCIQTLLVFSCFSFSSLVRANSQCLSNVTVEDYKISDNESSHSYKISDNENTYSYDTLVDCLSHLGERAHYIILTTGFNSVFFIISDRIYSGSFHPLPKTAKNLANSDLWTELNWFFHGSSRGGVIRFANTILRNQEENNYIKTLSYIFLSQLIRGTSEVVTVKFLSSQAAGGTKNLVRFLFVGATSLLMHSAYSLSQQDIQFNTPVFSNSMFSGEYIPIVTGFFRGTLKEFLISVSDASTNLDKDPFINGFSNVMVGSLRRINDHGVNTNSTDNSFLSSMIENSVVEFLAPYGSTYMANLMISRPKYTIPVMASIIAYAFYLGSF